MRSSMPRLYELTHVRDRRRAADRLCTRPRAVEVQQVSQLSESDGARLGLRQDSYQGMMVRP